MLGIIVKGNSYLITKRKTLDENGKKMNKDIANELYGKSVKKFYRTKKSKSNFNHTDGLGTLNWYDLIIEMESDIKYKIEEDTIEVWKSKNKLIEINPINAIKITKKKIVELIYDKEFEGIYLKFENEYVLHHDSFFGSEFMIERYDKLFKDSNTLK